MCMRRKVYHRILYVYEEISDEDELLGVKCG